jgi:hypothetical protein
MGGDGQEGKNDGDGERGRMKLQKLDKVIIKQGKWKLLLKQFHN